MLGGLYTPKGYALETAQAILDCKNVKAVNVAWGCTNGCKYPCYVPRFMHCTVEEATKIHYPKMAPVDIISEQLFKEQMPEGVFFSFLTDPLLPPTNRINTIDAIYLLHHLSPTCKIAVLSKTDLVAIHNLKYVRIGSTIVSDVQAFQEIYEPYAVPLDVRIDNLRLLKEAGQFVFVSMEPYPCKGVFTQDIQRLLRKLDFVDFIVFGKWNYNKLTSTPEAKQEYTRNVEKFERFCKAQGIRYHIKKETLKFIGRE